MMKTTKFALKTAAFIAAMVMTYEAIINPVTLTNMAIATVSLGVIAYMGYKMDNAK